MSTRAMIGVMEKNESITAVYVHSDGYLSYLGKLLLTHYNNEQSARDIVALGDLSSLDERLAPNEGEKHGFKFDERAEGVTVAYHRDRKEPFHQERCICIAQFKTEVKHAGAEYGYLYDCGNSQWLVRCGNSDFQPLAATMTESESEE